MELDDGFAGVPVVGEVDGFVVGEGVVEDGHSSNINISGNRIIYKCTPGNDDNMGVS